MMWVVTKVPLGLLSQMSFEDLYRRTCSEHKTQAYEPLLRKLHAAAIDADLDFLPLTKWDYFLSALTKCASSFRYVRCAPSRALWSSTILHTAYAGGSSILAPKDSA